jgi:poly(A) polymerase
MNGATGTPQTHIYIYESTVRMLTVYRFLSKGIHEPSADIDCILVAPHMCRRNDFFGTSTITESNPNRDPNSLAERIRRQPDVTNLVPIEGAAVPILTFDWEGINIDLLFARINSNSVGPDFDIDNDTVLDGADSATEKSLNGPRVTNLIAALVSGTPQRYQTFLSVVRCVRAWAKARGLYSNKMGYWGGVNINMGVALVVQLYPNACAASLLRKFFLVFKTWRWPQPVLLTKPHDASYGLPVWSPQSSARQVAPMITPAYPAMNSTLSISRQTLQIMQGEFERGHKIVDQLWKEYNSNSSNSNLKWDLLFEKSDFFVTYPVCLAWLTGFTYVLLGILCFCSLESLHHSFNFCSYTCRCALLAHRKQKRKPGLVLWNLDCVNWFRIFWRAACR